MKRIALVGFTGWAGIVDLAWNLANDRIDACSYGSNGCELRAIAARDAVLTNGLTVALVALLVLMLVARQPDQRARLSRLRPTLPDMFDFVRSRRWLIGVGAAAALSAVVWFVVRPVLWPGNAIGQPGLTIIPSDAVTDVYAIDAPGAGVAANTRYADPPEAAAWEAPQPVDDEPASAAQDAGE